jgi:hypothetical protein
LVEKLTNRMTYIDFVCDEVCDQDLPMPLRHIEPRSDLIDCEIALETTLL